MVSRLRSVRRARASLGEEEGDAQGPDPAAQGPHRVVGVEGEWQHRPSALLIASPPHRLGPLVFGHPAQPGGLGGECLGWDLGLGATWGMSSSIGRRP
jgi:hypothetical protein